MDYKKNFIDEIYEFKGLWDIPSKCGIKIVKSQEKTIVIVTELYDENPGTSITDFCAGLAQSICDYYKINPSNLQFIQHTPDIGSHVEFMREIFDKVEFDIKENKFSNPKWTEIKKEDIEKIINIV